MAEYSEWDLLLKRLYRKKHMPACGARAIKALNFQQQETEESLLRIYIDFKRHSIFLYPFKNSLNVTNNKGYCLRSQTQEPDKP